MSVFDGGSCSVLKGSLEDNPDADREILVQLHNVSLMVLRKFAQDVRADVDDEQVPMEVTCTHAGWMLPMTESWVCADFADSPALAGVFNRG